MMRSLFAGVSGLRNHQTRMDVIGNNIANVNTTGFKASRVNFQDILSQTVQGASAAQGNRGGTNPKQIGLGMGVASIDTIFTDGSYQTTGKQTDLSVTGQGFFIVADGATQYYTRAGNFDFDAEGNYLVPGTGLKVQGWMADANGAISTTGDIGSIQVPVGATMPANATTTIDFVNNLAGDAAVGASAKVSFTAYDSLGNAHKVNTNFIKVADNTWVFNSEVPDALAAPAITNTTGQVTFTSDGKFSSVGGLTPTTTTDFDVNITQLDSDSNSQHSVNSVVWDADLVPHVITTTFTCTSTNNWSYKVTEEGTTNSTTGTVTWDGTDYIATPASPAIDFGSSTGIPLNITGLAGTAPAAKAFTAPSTTNPALPAPSATMGDLSFTPTGGANPMTIKYDLSTLTQYGNNGTSTIFYSGNDGYAAGTLDLAKLTIDQSGVLIGGFTNGKSKNLAQLSLAVFNNPGGLNKAGSNLFSTTTNSGDPQIGTAGSGGRGTFSAGTLEMSNVDLAQQFSDMIITQRGFQANSKIITTTDEMLDLLANLKR
ncbi:MAG: flagellar hook protein FlgE [Firmicutes bacterium]|nr:flagellar hook protein FlgE [Bacillota bacterium]